MCGIIGYIGHRNVEEVLLKGLQTLEYRGYDSAGVVLLDSNGTAQVQKCVGKVQNLIVQCKKAPVNDALCGMGHTRWATHGGVTNLNAHPHQSGKVTLIHNGIIENYQELANEYHLADQVISETDTEVVAALLNRFYEGDPVKTIRTVASKLKGTYAFGIIFSDIKDKLFAIRHVSPIIAGVGKDKKEAFLSSDVTALSEYVADYFVIPEDVVTILEAGKITLLDACDQEVFVNHLTIDWETGAIGKNGYEFYMEKEIMEQPQVIVNTVMPRCKDGLPDLSVDHIPDDIWTKYEKITIIACGTAMHAGLVAKNLMQSLLRLPVTVEIASEYIYSDPVIDDTTLVIAISQSGETIDTLEAVRYARKHGADNLSIVNVKGSTIARESQFVLYTNAGPEIAVASTKAYITQLVSLYILICQMAYMRGIFLKEKAMQFMSSLLALPGQIEQVLADRASVHALTKDMIGAKDLFMIGRGLDYTALLEGSLKLKEISYIHSEAYASGELKHGTIALITPETPVITLITQKKLASKELSNAIEVKARGAKVVMLTTKAIPLEDPSQWEHIYYLPALPSEFMIFPAVVALQLIAFYVSKEKGLDVDKPRNLAKVVTVE
ncbi:MAG: glutamine--fructose-6-phosphate transaminase (isomerizing) [bacterium]|nr:glutamine--fructose-6-phosphate transaminase (isomerizing) [bacterium]